MITTVAGSWTTPVFTTPTAVAIDSAGDFYVTDPVLQSLFRFDAGGAVTTVVAGTGLSSVASGDGGPVANAVLNGGYDPAGVAVDGLGNIYVTDLSVVRKIDAAGTITTFAGQVDPDGMGPVAQAHLADPRALVISPPLTLIAGGSSGTLQAASSKTQWLGVVAGRYPQPNAIGTRARYRGASFGDVSGVAYDAAARLIYLTESSMNRVDVVTIVDPDDATTWTIAPLAGDAIAGLPGFGDGVAASALFRGPTGLYLDQTAHLLYVADTGNHVIRAIDLTMGMVNTVAGKPQTLGFFGDGGPADAALLYQPQAITRCSNGDFFVADTGNQRVRRIAAGTNEITTVLGVGVAASSGDGTPANTFPVDTPRGVACDGLGNVFVTSRTTVRLLSWDKSAGVIDGAGPVETIYGTAPRDQYPASVTACLTGIAVVDATAVQVADSCTGLLVEVRRR
jgi:hypothetical protein